MHRFLIMTMIVGFAACDGESESISGLAEAEAVNTAPCDAFFANTADRDTYSYPAVAGAKGVAEGLAVSHSIGFRRPNA